MPNPQTPQAPTKPRIWAMECPFRKDGSPVLGSFGSITRSVVIVPVELWTRLCKDNPALAATEFEVGGYE